MPAPEPPPASRIDPRTRARCPQASLAALLSPPPLLSPLPSHPPPPSHLDLPSRPSPPSPSQPPPHLAHCISRRHHSCRRHCSRIRWRLSQRQRIAHAPPTPLPALASAATLASPAALLASARQWVAHAPPVPPSPSFPCKSTITRAVVNLRAREG
ncbi:hypothetical protein FB451DRAFT_1280834 [Mycena latifolia]|nr:hypothetical protein FB451DRAFT_1280834 [Mycena latifolia]